MNTRSFESRSPEETRRFGASLAAELKAGDVLLLTGELGAGKTCLVAGLAEGLGCQAEAASPTFTLINEYKGGRLRLAHMDLYRIETLQAVEGLGLDEYFDGPFVSAVEWPERLGPLRPAGAWEIVLERAGGGEDARRIRVSAP
jgi:tRNA threonylcarbamoyladenosine biosynthesis protein TsaE